VYIDTDLASLMDIGNFTLEKHEADPSLETINLSNDCFLLSLAKHVIMSVNDS